MTTNNVRYAVRSLRPEITAPAVLTAESARREALEAAQGFVAERFPGFVPTAFFHFDGSFGVSGIALDQGVTARAEVPVGMRYDSKRKCIVPAKRTEEGKALAKEFDTLGYSSPRIDGLGGIVSGFNGDPDAPRHERQGYFLGWAFHVLTRTDGTTEVYATLPVEHLDDRQQNETIDGGDAWEPVRLSMFHLAVEEDAEAVAQAS